VSKRIVYFCLSLSLLLLFYYPPVSLAFLGSWGPFLMGDDDDPCGKETAWVPPSIAFSIPTPSQNQCISFSYKTCLSLFVSINFGYKYFPSI
jgi:hypothetical protein